MRVRVETILLDRQSWTPEAMSTNTQPPMPTHPSTPIHSCNTAYYKILIILWPEKVSRPKMMAGMMMMMTFSGSSFLIIVNHTRGFRGRMTRMMTF
jgi:hypothetical protein